MHANLIQSSDTANAQQPRIQIKPALLTVPHDNFLTLCRTLKTKAMAGDSKSIRDWTLILILGECGLKVSEAANLTWGNICSNVEVCKPKQFVHTRGYLNVKSGNDARLVPYSIEVEQALNLLKEVRTNLNLGTALNSNLFFGYLNVSRKTRKDSLHRHGIKFVIYEVCSGILGVPYNSESLRNHAILRWIGKGIDNKKVAALAGYSTMHSMIKFLNTPAPILKNTSKRKIKS